MFLACNFLISFGNPVYFYDKIFDELVKKVDYNKVLGYYYFLSLDSQSMSIIFLIIRQQCVIWRTRYIYYVSSHTFK